jgi:hypothetical protein
MGFWLHYLALSIVEVSAVRQTPGLSGFREDERILEHRYLSGIMKNHYHPSPFKGPLAPEYILSL